MKLDALLTPKWLLLALILVSLPLRLFHLDNPIIEIHGTRTTQTALTVLYWEKEGLDVFSYQTPVLGEPWKVPMEFPTYQLCVFYAHKVLSAIGITNLDVALRLVHIAFFYVSACLLYLVSKRFFGDAWVAVVVLAFYLFVPFSIFWSRSSMIEFVAVCFALGYCLFFMRFIEKQSLGNIVGAIILGALGFLTKITTMFPYCLLIAFLGLWHVFLQYQADKKSLITRNFVMFALKAVVMVIIPVALGVVWVKWSDQVKTASGAYWWTSKGTALHVYGSLAQRLSPGLWKDVMEFLNNVIPKQLLILCGLSLLFLPRKPRELLAVLVPATCALVAIFAYFNLYRIHDYYYCAILALLCMTVGYVLFTALKGLCVNYLKPEHRAPMVAAFVLGILALTFMHPRAVYYLRPAFASRSYFYDFEPRKSWFLMTEYLKRNTRESDWFLVFDSNKMSSETPYYAERKAWVIDRFTPKNEASSAVIARYEIGLVDRDAADFEEQKAFLAQHFAFETSIGNWEIWRNKRATDDIPNALPKPRFTGGPARR